MVKKIIAPFGHLVSQNSLINWTGRRTIFPFYHTIGDVDLPYISNLYPLRGVKDFKSDLEYFCKYFTPIGIDEVQRRIELNDKSEIPAFHLSFDDGLKEIHEIIAPILEKKGIPATFFVNTDFIGNKRLFYRYKVGLILERQDRVKSQDFDDQIKVLLQDQSKWFENIKLSLIKLNYHDQNLINEIADVIEIDFDQWLLKNKPYLSMEQIKDLIGRGFSIGSHSKDHPRFKNISLSDQKLQFEESFAHLERTFNLEERMFSFPFGDEEVSAQFFDWLYSDGKCKMSFGVSGLKDDYCPHHIHRIPMDNCRGTTQEFIKSEYLYYMLKSVFNKNQIKRN